MKSDVHGTALREAERQRERQTCARALHMCICVWCMLCMQAYMLMFVPVHDCMCVFPCVWVCVLVCACA